MNVESLAVIRTYMEMFLSIFVNPVLLVGVLAIHPLMAPVGLKLAESKGYNSLQVLWRPYLLFCLVFAILWQAFMYMVLTLGNKPSFVNFLLSQQTTVWGWGIYLVSLWCHYMFFQKQGIEGNVIGFIFFPILLVCPAYQVIHHFIWVYHQL